MTLRAANMTWKVAPSPLYNLYRISTFTLILKSLLYNLHFSFRFFKCTSQVKKVSALILVSF